MLVHFKEDGKANWRITMRKIKEILRLRYEVRRSIRQTRGSARISVGAIQKLLEEAAQAQLSWPLPERMGDAVLSQLLVPRVVRWCTG